MDKDITIASIVLIAFFIVRNLYYLISNSIIRQRYNIHDKKNSVIDFFQIVFMQVELALLLSVYLISSGYIRNIINDTDDMSDRIEKISENLSADSEELAIIQKELEARIEYIDNLKKEAEIAENVISLSEEQVNAVQAKISKEITQSDSKNLISNIVISAFFFLLGNAFQLIKAKKEADNPVRKIKNP